MKVSLVCFALVSLACLSAQGQTFKVIHSFSDYPNDGAHPTRGNVVFDKAGNLYGTTAGGGSGYGCGEDGCGSVYELSPNQDGTWTETVIYSFCPTSCASGEAPYGGLVLDAKGNLYGTTAFGGSNCLALGCGVLFELSPPTEKGGAWTETVLHDFCSDPQGTQCLDGWQPTGQLIFDQSGNLYGTASAGGSGHGGGGTAFELSPGSSGWTETVLYNFCSQGTGDNCPDGYSLRSGLTFDGAGNLYGTTIYSGNEKAAIGGTVYELARSGGGWKHQTLLALSAGSKWSILQAPITIDPLGNLYTTFSSPFGGVFQINQAKRKLNVFSFNGNDGSDPIGGAYIDFKASIAYGTTSGSASGPGNIFEITKYGKETVLHTFCSWTNCTDGEIPWSTLVPDQAGNLYGTTEFGGEYGPGVVFEITP